MYEPTTGRRRVRQFGKLRTALEATAYRAEVLAGRAGAETETVAQFIEQVWLPSRQGRVEISRLDQYSWAVRRQIVPLVGAVRLGDLTAEVADDWVAARTAVNKRGKARLGATLVTTRAAFSSDGCRMMRTSGLAQLTAGWPPPPP